MRWRLIVPCCTKEKFDEWVKDLSNDKNAELLRYGRIECDDPSESIMYFHLESSKLFYNLYKLCTRDYVESDMFKDMPTICPKRRLMPHNIYCDFQEWFKIMFREEMKDL